MSEYVLGIDQSTQGTKAILFDTEGRAVCRTDLPHEQIVNEKGWVEHDPEEIYNNVIRVIRKLVEKAEIEKSQIRVIGISNQRETAVVWDRISGEPIYNAIVWQCARGAAICERLREAGYADTIRAHTGLQLSPYFTAAKIAWIMENVDGVKEKNKRKELCCATMDSWLVYKLTGGREFRTDYSNASRTQLFHITELKWDRDICEMFCIDPDSLPEVTDSDGYYGETDLEGFLKKPIPIRAVLGDSHGALFGQGCLERGMTKATYGTGSSIMMNIGEQPAFSRNVVTSLAWRIKGKTQYVLEGNINYTGAVITWLKDDLKLITHPGETQELAAEANEQDTTYLVPAFSGLGAPYWDSGAKAAIWGMSRTTGRKEIVRAGLESIAYQITDVIKAMSEEAKIAIGELRVDGGPTRNAWLMQFQSDITGIPVQVPSAEELSCIGAAFAAGLAAGLYQEDILFDGIGRSKFVPHMKEKEKERRYAGWKEAVLRVLGRQREQHEGQAHSV